MKLAIWKKVHEREKFTSARLAPSYKGDHTGFSERKLHSWRKNSSWSGTFHLPCMCMQPRILSLSINGVNDRYLPFIATWILGVWCKATFLYPLGTIHPHYTSDKNDSFVVPGSFARIFWVLLSPTIAFLHKLWAFKKSDWHLRFILLHPGTSHHSKAMSSQAH